MRLHFSYRYLCALMLASVLLRTTEAAPPNDAQAILAASDAVRNPDFSFALTTTLTEYREGKMTEQSVLEVLSKSDRNSGQFRNLIRFLAPARDANKLMLKAGNDLWFYDPANKASIRISPQQRLLGQAANGDVVTANLALDYQAQLDGEEDIRDGDKTERHCYRLKLHAKTADVTYHHIELWIDTLHNQPLKARYYTESGRLLKTAFFRQYEKQLGQVRPTQTVIIDGLDPNWVTILKTGDYVRREVSEAWLQRDYLPQYKPQ